MHPNSWNFKKYAYGNSGATPAFDVRNGNYQTATLTANITPVVAAPENNAPGTILILDLIQDGTGSRTFTAPSNVKLAGGAITPTATATTGRSLLELIFDGTNWVERGRSLALA